MKEGNEMNAQNLIPIASRSVFDRKAIASKGGHASTAIRRQKKQMRSIAQEILWDHEVDPKTRQDLFDFGIQEDDICYMTAIIVTMVKQALNGNLACIRTFFEYTGDDPDIQIKQEELRIRKNDLKLRKRHIELQNGIMESKLEEIRKATEVIQNGDNEVLRVLKLIMEAEEIKA